MSFLISDLKDELEPKLHDTSIDKLSGSLYDKIYEAARNVLARIDPQETKRVTVLTNGLFDQVHSYVCPSDLKGDKIIELRAQVNNNVTNKFANVYTEDFDLRHTNNTINVHFDTGIKTIRISKALTTGITINDCESATANGTWVASSGASALSTDTVFKVNGSSSLKFTLSSASTTGILENSTMTAVDLTNYKNAGSLFVWHYIQTASAVTSIDLRWGNDSSNYYSSTATTAHDSTSFKNGWNLVRYDYPTAPTGTVTDTAIDYLRITYTYSTVTNLTQMRVDSVIARLPSPYEMVYYSKYLFRNSAGTWIEKPTADTDIINLDTESYNILLYELYYLIAQELQGEDGKFDIDFWASKKGEAWSNYMRSYKSESKAKQKSYYRKR